MTEFFPNNDSSFFPKNNRKANVLGNIFLFFYSDYFSGGSFCDVFILNKVICLVYVDDTLFFSPKEDFINEVIDQLSKADLDLEVKDSVAGFLGVHINRNTDTGTIKLTQSGLTKHIIEALNVGSLPRKFTPALKEPLVQDTHGDPPNGAYNYVSVIGMLQYLQGHSCPDITFAVSQCARFIHSPRRMHEIALEHIGQ
jgi:hypothetical protein